MTQTHLDLILDRIYANELAYANEIFLTQPDHDTNTRSQPKHTRIRPLGW